MSYISPPDQGIGLGPNYVLYWRPLIVRRLIPLNRMQLPLSPTRAGYGRHRGDGGTRPLLAPLLWRRCGPGLSGRGRTRSLRGAVLIAAHIGPKAVRVGLGGWCSTTFVAATCPNSVPGSNVWVWLRSCICRRRLDPISRSRWELPRTPARQRAQLRLGIDSFGWQMP